jgi:hypothetical protein
MTVVGGVRVRVQDNLLAGGGIRVVGGSENIIANNTIHAGNSHAIVAASPGIAIQKNSIATNKSGIVLRPTPAGSDIWWSPDAASIVDNNVVSKGCPVCLYGVRDVVVRFNELDGEKPYVHGSRGSEIHHNNIPAGGLHVRKIGWPREDFGPVNATANWWGSPDGAQAMDADDTPVLVVPWLVEPV